MALRKPNERVRVRLELRLNNAASTLGIIEALYSFLSDHATA